MQILNRSVISPPSSSNQDFRVASRKYAMSSPAAAAIAALRGNAVKEVVVRAPRFRHLSLCAVLRRLLACAEIALSSSQHSNNAKQINHRI